MERRKFLKAGGAMAGALARESGLYPWRIPITLAGECGSGSLPATAEFLHLEPGNLIMTVLKKSEDDDTISLRFYEAEGRANEAAHIKLFRPIKQAWKTNLIEEEPEPLAVNSDGTVKLDVKPWEIVTLKLGV